MIDGEWDIKKISAGALEAKKMHSRARATIADIKAKEYQDLMHDAEIIAFFTEDFNNTVYVAVSAWPEQLAKGLVSISNPDEAAIFVRNHIYDTMRKLADYKYDSEKHEVRIREQLAQDDAQRSEPDEN